jgi:hypothetical protein
MYLLNAPVPYTSGYSEAFLNVGSIENKGIEFALNTVNTTQAIKWNTSFNLWRLTEIWFWTSAAMKYQADPMLGIQRLDVD